MAQNPDPLLPVTSRAGATRTLDDWAPVFNLAIVVLPDRPEASGFVPVIDRIFATLGDADVRTMSYHSIRQKSRRLPPSCTN